MDQFNNESYSKHHTVGTCPVPTGALTREDSKQDIYLSVHNTASRCGASYYTLVDVVCSLGRDRPRKNLRLTLVTLNSYIYVFKHGSVQIKLL